MSSTFIVFAVQMHPKQRGAEEQACCRLASVTATLAANPCTHATENVPLPRHRLGLKPGSYRHVQHTHKESAINIENDTSRSLLLRGRWSRAPTFCINRSQRWRSAERGSRQQWVKFVPKLCTSKHGWAALKWQRIQTSSLCCRRRASS